MRIARTWLATLCLLSVTATAMAADQVTVWDDFEAYADGDLPAAAGGSFARGLGWNQGWFTTGVVVGGQDRTGGITNPGIGGAGHCLNSGNKGYCGRLLSQRVAIAPGTPVWVGLKIQGNRFQADFGGTGIRDSAFSLADSDWAAGDILVTDTAGVLHAGNVQWRVGTSYFSPAVDADDNAHFVAIRCTATPNGPNFDTTYTVFWFNTLTPSATTDSISQILPITIGSTAIAGFDRIKLRSAVPTINCYLLLDDLRIGNSFAAITSTTMPLAEASSPAQDLSIGGATVTITGANLSDIQTVNFGSNAATNVIKAGNGRSLTCRVPAATSFVAGVVSVTLTDSTGREAVVPFEYTAPPNPTFTSATPAGGLTAGGTVVTIVGTNFRTGNTAVSFGGTPGTGVSVSSPTQLTVTTPAHAAGAVAITITVNGAASASTTPAAFNYSTVAPTISAVQPAYALAAGGETIAISGTGFDAGSTVRFGTTPAAAVTFINATSLTAVTPAHAAGTVGVTVTRSDAVAVTASNALTYVASYPAAKASQLPAGEAGSGGGCGLGGVAAGMFLLLALRRQRR